MAPSDWILVVSTGIGGLFGLLCLFDGARRIALYGANSASSCLIGIGAVICLALAGYAYWKYSGQVEAHFVEFVMWLVWGAAALGFGTLFAREPAPEPVAEEDTKIEPVLAPPVAARAPQPAAAIASPKRAVGGDTVPLPKPGIPSVTVPLAKPSVGEDTVPIAKPAPGSLSPPPKKP
jgi:hypothetical protein